LELLPLSRITLPPDPVVELKVQVPALFTRLPPPDGVMLDPSMELVAKAGVVKAKRRVRRSRQALNRNAFIESLQGEVKSDYICRCTFEIGEIDYFYTWSSTPPSYALSRYFV
jgi:hypothetical protein